MKVLQATREFILISFCCNLLPCSLIPFSVFFRFWKLHTFTWNPCFRYGVRNYRQFCCETRTTVNISITLSQNLSAYSFVQIKCNKLSYHIEVLRIWAEKELKMLSNIQKFVVHRLVKWMQCTFQSYSLDIKENVLHDWQKINKEKTKTNRESIYNEIRHRKNSGNQMIKRFSSSSPECWFTNTIMDLCMYVACDLPESAEELLLLLQILEKKNRDKRPILQSIFDQSIRVENTFARPPHNRWNV